MSLIWLLWWLSLRTKTQKNIWKEYKNLKGLMMKLSKNRKLTFILIIMKRVLKY